MTYQKIRRLLNEEENRILSNYVDNIKISVYNDLSLYKEVIMNMKDIFISDSEQVKLFRNAERLFGDVHPGFINRFEIENDKFDFIANETRVQRNDRKAVLLKTKSVINNRTEFEEQLCLYIPRQY